VRIDPDSQQMVLADALAGTVYWELQGREIRARVDGSRVAETYLRERWNG